MAELHTCVAAGRLKGPDYVAVTTQVYRKAVDAAWEALTADSSSGDGSSSSSSSRSSEDVGRLMLKDSEWRDLQQVGPSGHQHGEAGNLLTAAPAERSIIIRGPTYACCPGALLLQVFARGQDGEHGGLTPGFLEGSRHQRLVRGRNPRHRGNFLGTVQRVRAGGRPPAAGCC